MTYAIVFTAGTVFGMFVMALLAAGSYGAAEGEAYHRAAMRDQEDPGR